MKMVRITRSVTVTVLLPADQYTHDADPFDPVPGTKPGDQMTDEQIVGHEKSLEDEDAFEAITDLVGIANEDDIKFTCDVTFEEIPDGDNAEDSKEVAPTA